MPASFVYYGEDVFRGKHIGNFFVSEENVAFSSIDGVLYDKNHEQILRYPPLRAYVEVYEIYPGVFQIADYAFYYMRSCEKITLPDTIEANGIGKYAFYQALISYLDMSNAKNVTIISEGMCQGCESLEIVDYPMISKDLTSIETISKYAFADCVSLPTIHVPYGVKSIEPLAFENCAAATTIDLPDSIISLGTYFINKCSSLTEVAIPSKLDTTPFAIITYCSGLKRIILPPYSYAQYSVINENGETIGTYDTEDEARLNAGENDTVEKISTIRGDSFYRSWILDCPNIEEYVLSPKDDGVHARVHDGALYLYDMPRKENGVVVGLENILLKVPYGKTSCDILSDISSIKLYAFENCSKLSDIFINAPALIEIAGGAFDATSSLHNLTILSDELPSLGRWINDYPFTQTTGSAPKNFYCSYGKVSEIQESTSWKSSLIDSAGFSISEFLINDDIYISKGTSGETNVYVSGSSMIPGMLITDESDEHYGYYKFAISGIADREPLDVLVDGVSVGGVEIRYGVYEYVLPATFAMRMSNPETVSTAVENDTVNISRVEYDILISKINQLSSKVQNL